jgi:hypothetical protein
MHKKRGSEKQILKNNRDGEIMERPLWEREREGKG